MGFSIVSIVFAVLMLGILFALFLLCIDKTVDIHNYQYTSFKDHIKYSSDIKCEKISFFRFLELFEKVEVSDDIKNVIRFSVFDETIRIPGVVDLSPSSVMILHKNEQKNVFFGFGNYLLYYIWLNNSIKNYKKQVDFDSKFVKGLFDDTEE